MCRGRTLSPNIWGPSLLGADFVRGRVCQGPSMLGAEMSRNRKKESIDQASIQSSTTPNPGYQWVSDNFTIRHQTRAEWSIQELLGVNYANPEEFTLFLYIPPQDRSIC